MVKVEREKMTLKFKTYVEHGRYCTCGQCRRRLPGSQAPAGQGGYRKAESDSASEYEAARALLNSAASVSAVNEQELEQLQRQQLQLQRQELLRQQQQPQLHQQQEHHQYQLQQHLEHQQQLQERAQVQALQAQAQQYQQHQHQHLLLQQQQQQQQQRVRQQQLRQQLQEQQQQIQLQERQQQQEEEEQQQQQEQQPLQPLQPLQQLQPTDQQPYGLHSGVTKEHPGSVYTVRSRNIDYANDPSGGHYKDGVVGQYHTAEEANAVARAQFVQPAWDTSFFTSVEQKVDGNGLAVVEARLKGGEAMHAWVVSE